MVRGRWPSMAVSNINRVTLQHGLNAQGCGSSNAVGADLHSKGSSFDLNPLRSRPQSASNVFKLLRLETGLSVDALPLVRTAVMQPSDWALDSPHIVLSPKRGAVREKGMAHLQNQSIQILR